jgi:hypothetical protein
MATEKMRTNENDQPQMVSAAPLSSTSPTEQHLYLVQNHPVAADSIQVVTIDEVTVGSGAMRQPDHEMPLVPLPPPYRLNPEVLSPPQEEINSSFVHVVTYDDEPENPRESPQQNQPSEPEHQEEVAPLLSANTGHDQSNCIGEERDYPSVTGDADDDRFDGARCRDIPWAILFWLHIFVFIVLGVTLSPKGYDQIQTDFDIHQLHDFLQENAVNEDDFTQENLEMMTKFLQDLQLWWEIYPARIIFFSIPICYVSFLLNIIKTHLIIQPFTLFFVMSSVLSPLICLGLIVILGFTSNPDFGGIFFGGLVISLVGIFMYKNMRPKIKFASLNLQIALHGIGHNMGTYIWAFGMATISCVWCAFWLYTTIGLLNYLEMLQCPAIERPNRLLIDDKDNFDPSMFVGDPTDCESSFPVILLLLLSFYWTCTFIGVREFLYWEPMIHYLQISKLMFLCLMQNSVQVYVAGVMATWCFDKDAAKGCCSSAVTSSMYRSLTFSSGPIAFGSLLQDICKMIRSVLRHSNRNQQRDSHAIYDHGDDCRCCCFGLAGLILDCLSEIFEDVLDYFSQWSYVFVGIHGYSYLESGKAVMKLFQKRGWMALVTDRLVTFVLTINILENAILTGLCSIGVERLISSLVDSDSPSWVFGASPNVFAISFA